MTGSKREATPPEERILWAAAGLLQKGGAEVFSMQAVAGAAGVQPAVVCSHFGDRDGLLDALVSFLLQGHLDEKHRIVPTAEDPVVQLRRLWDLHVDFGLTQPDSYVLAYSQARAGRLPSAAAEAIALLTAAIRRLGEQGRLTMTVERAINYFRSSGAGFILTQMSLPPSERDPELSSIIFENTVAAMTGGAKAQGLSRSGSADDLADHAVALQEALRQKGSPALTPAELSLLFEFLTRLGGDHS